MPLVLHINVFYLSTCMLNYGEAKMRSVEYFNLLEMVHTQNESKNMFFVLIFLLQETPGLPIKFQIITVRERRSLFIKKKIKFSFPCTQRTILQFLSMPSVWEFRKMVYVCCFISKNYIIYNLFRTRNPQSCTFL